MQKSIATDNAPSPATGVAKSASMAIVLALSLSHGLNDMVQALLPAIYPIIKESYGLTFSQIGLLSLAFQLTASMIQPMVGIVTDRKPQPFSLSAGMCSTLAGLFVLAYAGTFNMLLVGAALIGTGSAIFHPEATRMARMASGGRHGFAQSMFQVGGQVGQAIGPLLAAFIIVPHGQESLTWFSAAVLLAMLVLFQVGTWYRAQNPQAVKPKTVGSVTSWSLPKGVALTYGILLLLMFSKSAYSACLSKYYTFYLIERFSMSVQFSQYLLFVFLATQALGSLIGGYLGDRVGRRKIIWFSILGALPFTLALPFCNLFMTIAFTAVIGAIMASAFPAILVYALDLMPGKIGAIAGAFYGVSFGLGALSAAGLGVIADWTSVTTIFSLCAFLPVIGLMTWFLPVAETSGAKAGH